MHATSTRILWRGLFAAVMAITFTTSLTACGGCTLSIEPFWLTVLKPDGFALNPGTTEVLTVPTKLRLRTNVQYDGPRLPVGCGYVQLTARQVQFRNGSVVLNTDPQAPFEYEWNLVPGADGIPTSGTGEIVLTATDDNGSSTAVLNVAIQISNP